MRAGTDPRHADVGRWLAALALGAACLACPRALPAAHTWLDWLGQLPLFGWSQVGEGQTLGSWDMLWIQKDGWVEIEIVRPGALASADEDHDVVRPDGTDTHRKRYPGNSYVVVHPDFWLEVRVRRVVGDVWASTERDRVEVFYLQHRSRQAVWGWSSPDDVRRWRDSLREDALR
jgi:hypothetical protein